MLNKIKAAQVQARKDRNSLKATLLTTLIGEAEMVGKNANRATTNDEILLVIQKFVKNINETISILSSKKTGEPQDAKVVELQAEREILQEFLPKQLTDAELIEHVRNIIAGVLGTKSTVVVGDVMSHLKNRFNGLYDGKTASVVVKNLIQELT